MKCKQRGGIIFKSKWKANAAYDSENCNWLLNPPTLFKNPPTKT